LKIFFHSELQPSKSKFVHIYKIPGNILHNTGALLGHCRIVHPEIKICHHCYVIEKLV